MKITTVLLDAGGVLLDETDHEARWEAAIVRHLALRVPGYDPEAYRRDVAEAVRMYVPRVYLHILFRHLGSGAGEAFRELREERAVSPPHLRLMPGIRPELDALAGRFRLGVAGQYGADLFDLLDREGISGLFARRLTQDDFTLTKPDPRYLLQIAAALGIEPGECVMVGDRIDKDVIPARQVGMATVRIRLGLHRAQEPRLPEEVPDVQLNGVAGLARAIGELATAGAPRVGGG